MNYNDLVPEAEQMTICPYNKAHVVLNFRFNNHLIKCRKSYTGEDLETCPFNSSHIIPKPEFYFHKKTCIDRKNVLNYLQSDQTEKTKEKKKVKDWDEDEKLETKDAKLKILRESSAVVEADLNDNEVDIDQIVNGDKNREDRHGYDDESCEKTDDTPYNPMSHLFNALKSNNAQHSDESDRHSVNSNQCDENDENISNDSEKPKKVLEDWGDEEDDVPDNSYANRAPTSNFHNETRSYRESSTDSFRSNRSHFHQNKNSSRFSRNHSKSPHSSRSHNSPYKRPESRQFRGTSRESDSNVSTTSRNFHHRHFDRQNSRTRERYGSHESPGSRGSSRNRDFRDNRSREPSRSRESSLGYNKSRFGHDRRNSNASGYNNRHGNPEDHQSYSNGRFERQNSGNSSNYEDEFAKIVDSTDNNLQDNLSQPQIEEVSHNEYENCPNNQPKRKLLDWSDSEDDVPVSNQNLNQNSPNSNSSPQNNYLSLTSEVDASTNPPETQKRKLQGWSDDEDDCPSSSAIKSNNFSDSYSKTSNWNNNTSNYDSERWDDNANEIDKIPNKKSKKSRQFFSDRPSDVIILERFAQLSQLKNFLSVDSWFDKKYRGKMDGNIGMFNWDF